MWRWVIIIGLVCLPLSALAQKPENEEQALIRLGHLASGLDQVEIRLDERIRFPLLPLVFSEYFGVSAGEHDFSLLESDLRQRLSFEAGKQYTILLTDAPQTLELLSIEEDSSPLADNASVSLIIYNALPESDFNVQLGSTAEALVTARNYWATTLPADTYEANFTHAESSVWKVPYTLHPYHSYFIGITERQGEITIGLAENSQQSQITLQHFLLDPLTFSLFLDDRLILGDVGYQANVDWHTLQSGRYALKIVTSNLGDEQVIFEDEDFFFRPDVGYAFILQGEIDSPQFKIAVETLDFEASEGVEVRLRNSLVDVEAIDLIGADGLLYLENLAFGQVGSLSLLPGKFDWRITRSGDPTQVLFELSGIELEAGRSYELVATGRLEAILQGQQRLFVRNQCFSCP